MNSPDAPVPSVQGWPSVEEVARVIQQEAGWRGFVILDALAGGLARAVLALFEAVPRRSEAQEQHTGRVVEAHFSDGQPKTCGMCDDCCQCCDADEPDPEGTYLTVRLDDSSARVGFGAVTVTYQPKEQTNPTPTDARTPEDDHG